MSHPDNEIIRGFEALVAKQEAKKAALPADGFFSELRGTISFSEAYRIPTLPLSLTPLEVTRSWNSVDKLFARASHETSPYKRALVTCLDNPGTDESKQVFSFLTDQITEPPFTPSHSPEEIQDWTYRFLLVEKVYNLIVQKNDFERRLFGNTEIPEELQQFSTAFEMTRNAVKQQAVQLGDDIPTILLVNDAFNTCHETASSFSPFSIKEPKQKFLSHRRDIPTEFYAVVDDIRDDHTIDDVLLFASLNDTLVHRIQTVSHSWDWNDITIVASASQNLRSETMRCYSVDLINSTIENSQTNPPQSTVLALHPLADLIHSDIENNLPFDADPITRSSNIPTRYDAEIILELSNATLPRKFVPIASLDILSELATQTTPTDYQALLSKMQEHIMDRKQNSPTTLNEWLLLLTLLQNNTNEQTKEQIEVFLQTTPFPHEKFKEVALSQSEGTIFLLPDGKIRVANHGLSNAFVLHTSSFVPEVAEPTQKLESAGTIFSASTPAKPDTRKIPANTQLTKRQLKKERKRGAESAVMVTSERTRPNITYTDDEMSKLTRTISDEDRILVTKALEEHQTSELHKVIPLRGRDREGNLRYKIRINGSSSGIRIILVHQSNNTLAIESIDYRGNAYQK